MPYRYLENIAIADAAFEAWGETMEEMFMAAADAAVNVKDEEQMLLRVKSARIAAGGAGWNALVETAGEPIDCTRHDLGVDVKAITLYQFKVQQTSRGWNATVVVDV